jgi:hypothetical protein
VAAADRGAGAAPTRTLKTAGRVFDLAADGERVAVAVRYTRATCDRVVVWNVVVGSAKVLDTATHCPSGQVSAADELGAIALAGRRVAWLQILHGNAQYLDLITFKLPAGKPVGAAWAINAGGAEGSPVGDYLGDLHGDGSLLGYGRWSICVAYPAGSVVEPPPEAPCDVPAAGDEPVEVRFGEQLFRVGRATPLGTDSTAFRLYSVDAGRLLTHQEAGSLTLVDRNGAVLRSIAVAPGQIGGAALSGNVVAVLRGRSIEVFAADSGVPGATVPLGGGAGGAHLVDLKNGLAVVLVGRNVRIVRLADGAQASIAVPGSGAVDAQLEARGLSYGYNVSSGSQRGRVVFVPMDAVDALLR